MAGEHAPTQQDYDAPLEVVYTDFSGGFDGVSKRDALPPNTALFAENCWCRGTISESNLYGSLRTRPGYTILLENPLGAGAGSLTNLCVVNTTAAVTGQWVFALVPSTGGIYVTPWPAPLAWALITTIPGATEMRAVSFSGRGIFCVYGPGAVGGMFSFDGAAWAAIAGTPIARYIELHRGRVFVAAPDTAPFQIFYSDLFDPLTWPVTNIIPNVVDSNPNWQITGLMEYRDRLYVSTGLSFYALVGSGPPDYEFYKVTSWAGCSSARSLSTDGSYIYFLSNKGFMRWDGSSEPDNISRPVWNYYRNDFDGALANTTQCVYHDEALYIVYRTLTGTNKYRGMLHDLWGSQSRGWYPTRIDTWNFASLLTVENGLYIIAGDALNGRLVRLDNGHTDGANGIDTEWRHRPESEFGNPAYKTIQKRLNRIEILAELDVSPRVCVDIPNVSMNHVDKPGIFAVVVAGPEKVEIDLYPDFNACAAIMTDGTTDMDLRSGTSIAGSHISELRAPYDRTVVLFVAPAPQDFPLFNAVSWAVKRTGAKTAMTILAVKLIAHLAASQQ